jgi:hypothetical protein
MNGSYNDCECYRNNGDPLTNKEIAEKEQEGGTMTGGNQEDVEDWFPEGAVTRECDEGEIAIPNTSQCWRICPVGANWVNGKCEGYPSYSWYEEIEKTCKSYRPDYRLAKLEEIAWVLTECYPNTFSKVSVNYCSPYLKSVLRNILQLTNGYNFSTWVGELQECKDIYGFQGKNCAWIANFNTLNKDIPSTFNFLRTNKQVGSALSSGICVRE